MIPSASLEHADAQALIRVRSLAELDWFVKESEMVTSQPGRCFIVAGADRQTFRVRIDVGGYEICCVDQPSCDTACKLASTPEIAEHTLGNALASGLLYTGALQ